MTGHHIPAIRRARPRPRSSSASSRSRPGSRSRSSPGTPPTLSPPGWLGSSSTWSATPGSTTSPCVTSGSCSRLWAWPGWPRCTTLRGGAAGPARAA